MLIPLQSARRRPGHRFALLDGLRGIGAAVVLLGHLVWPLFPAALPNGVLAVDFFCCLSGFVLCTAYDDRLRAGTLAARDFLLARAIRLYPMLLLGMLLGSFVLLARLAAHADRQAFGALAQALPLGIALMPWPAIGIDGYAGLAFPLDAPVWTLFFVVVLNALYAVFARSLGTARLAGIVAVAAVGLCSVLRRHDGIDGGAAWGSFVDGGWRVLFSVAAGALLARLRGPVRPVPGTLRALLLAGTMAAVLLSPLPPGWLWHGVVVFACIPSLVLAAAAVSLGPRVAATCLLAGRISYPLYVLNAPLARVVGNAARAHGLHGVALACAVAFSSVGIVLIAAGCTAAIDEPVRAALMRRLGVHRDRSVPAAT